MAHPAILVEPPARQIRAVFDQTTITVYQAFSPSIAIPAIEANTFVPPFKPDRMTWIKPSFLWMMYRSGWATKPGQETVLAIRMLRRGFEEALLAATLSQFEEAMHGNRAEWEERKRTSQVRVQWDPERSLDLTPLPWRSIQIGLTGLAVHKYLSEWIVSIDNATDLARSVQAAVQTGGQTAAAISLPSEAAYPLPRLVAAVVGASDIADQ